jgi:glycolate oxidase iron-sulfur subunit
MALIKAVLEGRLPLSDVFEDRLDTCASCLACEALCASSVPVTGIIQGARELAVLEAGTGLVKSIVAAALKNDHVMRASAWLAPLALHYGQRVLRPAPRKGQGTPEGTPGEKGKKEKLIFFPGCSITYFQPSLGADSLAVLQGMGYEVLIPEGLSCCGRPLLSLGDRRGAEEAARHNRSLLAGLGTAPVVTACASCALTFKKEYPKLLGGGAPEMPEVLDIHEVLSGRMDRLALGQCPQTITWHDPCHLGRGQGLEKAARQAVRAVPGVTLLEMKDPDRCCGFGGVMRMTHRHVSDRILEDKVRNILKTPAQTVVTGCPSCRTQLADGLRRSGSVMEVLHTVELIARSMRNSNEGRGTKSEGTRKEKT